MWEGKEEGGEVLKLLCTPEKTVCEFDKILSFAEMIDQESSELHLNSDYRYGPYRRALICDIFDLNYIQNSRRIQIHSP